MAIYEMNLIVKILKIIFYSLFLNFLFFILIFKANYLSKTNSMNKNFTAK
jgi:hypothetical protein